MKVYITPKIEIIEVEGTDIITASPGTETPTMDETDGIWEFGLNP